MARNQSIRQTSVCTLVVALVAVHCAVCSAENRNSPANAGDDMEQIYNSLRISNVRITGGPYATGDTVAVMYEITNTSDIDLSVPIDHSFSRPFNVDQNLYQYQVIESMGCDAVQIKGAESDKAFRLHNNAGSRRRLHASELRRPGCSEIPGRSAGSG